MERIQTPNVLNSILQGLQARNVLEQRRGAAEDRRLKRNFLSERQAEQRKEWGRKEESHNFLVKEKKAAAQKRFYEGMAMGARHLDPDNDKIPFEPDFNQWVQWQEKINPPEDDEDRLTYHNLAMMDMEDKKQFVRHLKTMYGPEKDDYNLSPGQSRIDGRTNQELASVPATKKNPSLSTLGKLRQERAALAANDITGRAEYDERIAIEKAKKTGRIQHVSIYDKNGNGKIVEWSGKGEYNPPEGWSLLRPIKPDRLSPTADSNIIEKASALAANGGDYYAEKERLTNNYLKLLSAGVPETKALMEIFNPDIPDQEPPPEIDLSSGKYKTAADVQKDFKAGKISKEAAISILKANFGME